MKLCVKKLYCPNCKKLVRGEERVNNGTTRIFCRRCGMPLWMLEGVTWRYLAKSAQAK